MNQLLELPDKDLDEVGQGGIPKIVTNYGMRVLYQLRMTSTLQKRYSRMATVTLVRQKDLDEVAQGKGKSLSSNCLK